MSWTPLAPVMKSTGSAQVTARIAEMKSGARTLIVFISEMLHTELGGLDHVDYSLATKRAAVPAVDQPPQLQTILVSPAPSLAP